MSFVASIIPQESLMCPNCSQVPQLSPMTPSHSCVPPPKLCPFVPQLLLVAPVIPGSLAFPPSFSQVPPGDPETPGVPWATSLVSLMVWSAWSRSPSSSEST